jgi:peptide deformylase
MIDTMHDAMGVGLAAPQIGMMRRMFVAEPEEGEIYCFVNPEIIYVEGEQECIEGCLSVPGYQGVVIRPEKIRIKGLDYNGEEQEYEFEGFHANVMLHEFDHLEGILYVDKANNVVKIEE